MMIKAGQIYNVSVGTVLVMQYLGNYSYQVIMLKPIYNTKQWEKYTSHLVNESELNKNNLVYDNDNCWTDTLLKVKLFGLEQVLEMCNI